MLNLKKLWLSISESHRFLLTLTVYLSIVIFQINAQITCPPNTWSCANGIQCINSTKLCDSSIDCNDGSDEGTVCNSTCSVTEFKCATGNQCIRRSYLCDHDKDCDDGSDELNCAYPKCASNQFTCSNMKCINLNYVCDGDDDCDDMSDERFCASRNCPPNQLACNTSKCIDIEKFCNGVADCPDQSDEKPTCASNKCAQLSCLHGCRPTPQGGVCFCPRGQMLNPANNRTCIDLNECEMWDECDQICVNLNNSYRCECKANYTMMPDGHCKHQTSDQAKVLFSIGNKIFETDKNGQNMRTLLEDDTLEISNFDYNFAKNTFFFTDEKSNKIYKGLYSSTGRFILQLIVSNKIQGPFSLAIDWLTDQIYLVQQSVARVDVLSADGLNRTNLITSNIRKPSSIALDPSAGFLFFTDIGSSTNKLQPAKIERAYMDGSNRRVIIKDKLLEPIAITLDQLKQRIYWIDRKYDHLETSDYFGSKRFIIASGSNNLPHSISLDIFENTIYYADSTKLAIMKLGRHTITSEANITSHYKLNNVKPRNVKLFHQTKQSLGRLNPCNVNNSGCEHFCLLSHSDSASMNNYRCRCKIGYQLRRDLKTCEPINEFLLLSQSNMIRAVSVDQTVDTEARLSSIMPRVGLIRSLEVDCKNNRSFYYDPIRRAIFQSNLQIESVEDKVLIPDGLSFVENLAYDWIANNLYFTNGGKITVVQLNNPSNKRELIDKSQVYGLTLDPNTGFLFFSTISRPAKIHRALLDGTNLTAIVQSGLSLPYTISIDYQSKRIYWADSGLARIQSCDYEGNNIVTILSSGVSTPMSLNVFKFNLYFIDSRLYNIYKMPKFYSSVPSLIDSNINNLYQIKVFSKDIQTSIENHPCSRQNGDCSHFCFAVPSLDPRYKLSRHCGCPYGMKLDNDMATCITNPNEPKIDRCQPPTYFKCNNNRCVRRSDVCDGLNDCLDFSDEASCTQVVCPVDYFRCRNGTCIPQSKRCDGRFDCIDFSDEIQCVRRDCDRTQFKCSNGTCIPRSWMCDTENDCGDSSDEANCTLGQCDPLTQFECHGQSGRCIDKSFVCDGANDCINNYDEENCQPITCSPSQFKCTLDNICINSTKRCDGYNDCPSLQDEQNCNQNPIRRSCRENEFRCQSTTSGHATCLPQRWVCDGHKDCPDGSDEPATCPRAQCSSGYFRCNNTNCIPQAWTCDGEDDCGDNSDERLNCPGLQTRCAYDQLKCLGSMDICINKTQLCNQVQDCPDGSDEGAFCSRDDCAIRNGGCSHSCHRSPMGAVCFCPIGFETTNDTNYKKCQDIDECKMETACSQRCANFPGSYNCLCDPGYYKSGPNSCKAIERNHAKVFVTNGRSLIISDIDGTYMRVVRKPYVMNEMTAFDFNNRTKRIYWADKTTRAIYSSNENGTNAVKLVSSGIGFVESLAVDWIGMNLYWADYVMQHIEVSNLDGQRRKILFNKNVINPRGLVLDPRAKFRLMFWTDWGKFPRIERANMDGTNRTAIITDKIFWPNGLAIDLIKERLYFADSHLDYIESCDYWGQKRTLILANDLTLHHPHSLSIFENNIFWVDRSHKQLIKLDRFDSRNKTAMYELASQALTVKVAHALLQPVEESPCLRANCEHLCLLSPVNAKGYECQCQIGYLKDANNENRCNIDNKEFLIIFNRNVIGGMRIFSNDTASRDETSTPTDSSDNQNESDGNDEDDDDDSINDERYADFLWDHLIPVNDVATASDFTYDYQNQYIYMVKMNQSAWFVERVRFDGTNRSVVLANPLNSQEMRSVCIELDSASNNLFVGNTENSQIEAVNLRTKQRTTIYSNSQNETGVGDPVKLVINTADNEIYWIDRGYDSVPKKIGSVKMDGSSSRTLVDTGLNNPVSLVYHKSSRRIFWADNGRNKIESVSVDDLADRKVVVSDVEDPGAIAIWDIPNMFDASYVSILYYSDLVLEQIVAFNLKTSEKRVIKNNAPFITQMKLYQQPDTSNSNPCRVNNGGCQQICLPSLRSLGAGVQCRCGDGFELQSDNTCSPFKQFILYATSQMIRGFPFTYSVSDQQIEALPVINGKKIGKFDFLYRDKSLFWIEDDRLVKMLTIDSTSSTYTLTPTYKFKVLFELDSSAGSLTSIAVDWTNGQLYYSYSDSANTYIKVTKVSNPEVHRTIFQSKSEKPTFLAINPKLRFLYWIDKGQFAKLARAYLDGSNKTVLIDQDIVGPTDLFVDVDTGDLYWSDNIKDTVDKCNWDGKERRTLKNNLPDTKSVFVLNKILYYADSRLKAVYSLDLTSLSTNQTAVPNKIKKIKNRDLSEVILFTDKAQTTNIDSPCVSSNCEQFCFAMPVQPLPKCSCAIGELEANGRTCKAPNEYLIYAMETQIRSLNTPTFSRGDMPWRPVTGLNKTIGIDFDYRDNKIIFTDINEKKIAWFDVNVENAPIQDLLKRSVANSTNLIDKPEGVAYDWTTDTIYYTDSQLNIIASYKPSTNMRFVLGFSDSPRAIVVHPCKGYLFWSDVGRNPMIARSSLAGSNFKALITTNIKWPNGLTIDFDQDKLYWADAYYDKIESCDLDGNYRTVLTASMHPFAITVHHHYIYWTDWSSNSIYRAEKYRGSNTMSLASNLPNRPMDIHVWSEQRQKCTYNPCLTFNGGCSHICSVAPPGNVTECRCPYGQGLKLANNDRTCVPIVSRCNATQFTCGNGNCIPKRYVCDGSRHCADNSDESVNYCAFHRCQPSEFRCRNGRCISMPERCDKVDQCGDNSDELNCAYPTCNAQTEFQCKNFKCIPLASRCNGVIDCNDGNSTDEVGCPPINCTSSVFDVKCPNTNVCIMRRWLCDGDNDCGDGADENRLFCNSVPCADNQFRCRDHKCIPFNWFCDGDRDCAGGEDEPPNQCQSGNYTCPPSFFKCDSGRCIERSFVCDGDRDCLDNSDEDEERHNCLDRPCKADEFRCESGVKSRARTKCIRRGLLCDGYAHCVNSEDETHPNCTRRTCAANEFTCKNGLCINKNYLCDHDDDCGDGSDEPHNCTYTECTSSQFKCDNLRCVASSQKCNGRNDCFDNSDEKSSVCQNSTCPLGHFTCNNRACVAMELVCNGARDCSDNSDESGCGVNECASPILNRCDHICRDTLTSFRCECRPGYKLVDRFKCIDVNECRETPDVCAQLCINQQGSYVCKCADGYEKVSLDARHCKIMGPQVEANLLFTNNYYLRNISLNSNIYNLIKEGFVSARGVDYDYNQSTLFVLDGGKGELYKLKLNTSSSSSSSTSHLVSNVEKILTDLSGDERGLAFDWIAKKLYYLNNNRLTVCDANGHFRSVLLNESYLQEATSIVLDPEAGFVFFTDWKYPAYVGRVDMDGKNFKKIVTTDIGSPIGLTVDIVTKRIWWSDTHLKRIEFSDYNGRNRFVAIGAEQTHYPFSVAFFQGLLYWTDRTDHSIYVADALNGKNQTSIRQNTIHSVFDLAVYHYSLQPSSRPNPCATNNGGCSHLCLLGAGGGHNYSCACSASFLLDVDNKTCVANCSQWHFKCGMPDERCIPYYWRCDGEADCRDGSDELNCPARTCPVGVLQCNNSRCVGFTQLCDGFDDCRDNSDENNCLQGCPPGRFQCANSRRCILNNRICDGRNDCGDMSDEQNCFNFTCPAHKFKCNSGHCIDASYFCDEDFDCADRSDEPAYTCRNRPCPSGWTRCGNNSYKCIHSSHLCDGRNDCPNGSDETLDKCPRCNATRDFKCGNNRCIPLSLRCNQMDDCGDNSDESASLCRSLPQRQCSESEFRCRNGQCIRGAWRCDHSKDCSDNSDEENCSAHQCAANHWQCKSGHCIPQSQHCNKIRNCLDLSDETNCPPRYPNGKFCLDSEFTCNNTFCVDAEYVCDGQNDCGDASDETLALCSNFNCTKENSRFRCRNGLCIHLYDTCNGFNDCSDGSDEDFTSNGVCKRTHVECAADEFKCAATHLCIPNAYVCDSDLDCGDADESDELGCYHNETLNVDTALTCESTGHLLCEHNCTNLSATNGFICSCHHGFKMVKSNHSTHGHEEPSANQTLSITEQVQRHTCEDIDECQAFNSHHCPQLCENLKGSYKCKCEKNYVDSHGDGSVCEAAWSHESIVLVAYGEEIRQLRQNYSNYVYNTIVEDQLMVLAMDVDPIDRTLYWIDEASTEIKRSYIPVSRSALGHPQTLVQGESHEKFTALSVDWLSKNIYYAEATNGTISVAKNDGRYSKVLIRENANHVSSLVVNPMLGLMYWINNGLRNTAIYSASLNGDNVQVLVSTHLNSPSGLAVDYFMSNRVFWCDHKTNVIESITFDGSDRVRVNHVAMRNPFKIDVFENHVYWLANDLGTIKKVDKFGRGAAIELIKELDLVEDIKVFHELKVPLDVVNPCSNNSCSHLCLLKPNNDFECACPENSNLIQNDLFTCDAALEEPLKEPLACNCVNCWCWYNDHGVHTKCFPEWKGDLCEVNRQEAFIQNVKTFSSIGMGILVVCAIAVAISGYVVYRRKNNLELFPSFADSFGAVKFGSDTRASTTTLESNSEISPSSETPSSSSKPSSPKKTSKKSKLSGFLNPLYSKKFDEPELSMDNLNISQPEETLSSSAISKIFSLGKDKDKNKQKFSITFRNPIKDDSLSESNLNEYDSSTVETFNDKINLIVPSSSEKANE